MEPDKPIDRILVVTYDIGMVKTDAIKDLTGSFRKYGISLITCPIMPLTAPRDAAIKVIWDAILTSVEKYNEKKVECSCGWYFIVDTRSEAVSLGQAHLKACGLNPVVYISDVEIIGQTTKTRSFSHDEIYLKTGG